MDKGGYGKVMYITSDNKLKSVSNIDIKENTLLIPYGVEVICSKAIDNLPTLTKIIFPATLKRIESHAISNTGIIHLVIPETITHIDNLAFENNKWLTILEITNPDTAFNGTVVQNCKSLTTVRVGALRYNVRCLKFGVAYEILNKKMVDVYTVYRVQPFKESTGIGALYVAVKQGVVGDGTTIKRAIEDCHNLYLTPNIIDAYKNITLDTQVNSFDYKRITGACDEGILAWMKDHNLTESSTMTVRELIGILNGAYGAKIFAQFIADRYRDRAEARDGSN